MSTTRTDQKRATRAALIAAARELFTRQGYTATSAEAIARAAGVSRATFYLHFRSKAEVVIELMKTLEPEVSGAYVALDQLPNPSHDDVVAWLEAHAGLWRTYGMEFAAMEQALANEPAVADQWFALHRRTQELMANLVSRAPEPERALVRAHLMSLMMSVDRSFYFMLIRGHDEDYADVVHVLADQWVALLRRGR
ncbi:TetR/AcrR family transcriptional regulator [Georgenia sp. SYP-B2076]|uniref:TetR/AcrR family transcriptional regulator n=1 Tax=Georgenia sp. SYP-B2076 TaxID=2495881 RepID=UPI0013DFDF0A|nr:TetR/AcrR family transcriptional regulator [Georgenia sp. SYP-B2076]